MKGRRTVKKQLVTFRQWCNKSPLDEEMVEDNEGDADVILNVTTSERKTRMVPMTHTKNTLLPLIEYTTLLKWDN